MEDQNQIPLPQETPHDVPDATPLPPVSEPASEAVDSTPADTQTNAPQPVDTDANASQTVDSQATATQTTASQTATQVPPTQTAFVPPPPAPPGAPFAPTASKPHFSWFTFWVCLFLCLTTLLLSCALFLVVWIRQGTQDPGNTIIYSNTTITENTGAVITEEQSVEAVNRTKNSVVEVEVAISREGYEKGNIIGAGSGVVWSGGEGATFSYIVTNYHVVEGATYFMVITSDGTKLPATLEGSDIFTDLAVLRVEQALTPIPLSSNAQIKEGMSVLAIGNPLGTLGGTKTFGKISAISREIEIDGITLTLLQHDAAVNNGNSGGGLFDIHGRLVGIVNAKTSGTGVEGLGFAIPIDTVKDVATQIIDKGYVSGRPQLGVTILSYDSNNAIYKSSYDADYPGLSKVLYYDGLYVVKPESVNPQFQFGDYIYTMDGTEISDMDDVKRLLFQHKVGDVIEVVVLRHTYTVGKYPQYSAVTLKITLTERTA